MFTPSEYSAKYVSLFPFYPRVSCPESPGFVQASSYRSEIQT